jgi:hypothetical protein
MILRALIFVLSFLCFQLQAQIQPVPFNVELELLDPYANHANWKEDPEDPTSWLTYDAALDEWEWPELELPQLWMQKDSSGKYLQLVDATKKLITSDSFLALELIYHPANKKFYIRFKSKETKRYGLMNLNAEILVPANYRFLEILPWGNKNFDPLFLYSRIASNNSFTKTSELGDNPNIFGTLNPETNKSSPAKFFKVIILPHAETYLIATKNNEDELKYALYSKYLDALTAPIFETTKTLKKDWDFEEDGIFGATEEAGIARPLYYNTVINQPTIILKEAGKMVVYDYEGNQLLGPKYDSLFRSPSPNLYLFKNKGAEQYGAVNLFGEELLKAEYEEIIIDKLGGNLYSLGALKGAELMTFALLDSNMQLLTDFIFSVKEKLVVEEYYDPMTYDHVEDSLINYQLNFDSTLFPEAIVLRQGEKACVYDYEGTEVIPPLWDSIKPLEGDPNLFIIEYEGYQGLMDRDGKVRMKPQFLSLVALGPKAEYYIAKQKDSTYCLVNEKGKLATRKRFKSFFYNQELQLAALSKNAETYALFNPKLKRLTPYKFTTTERIVISFDPSTLEEWNDTFAIKPAEMYFDSMYQTVILQTAQGQGLFNTKGQAIIPPKYKQLSYFIDSDKARFYIKVTQAEDEMALFDQKGKQYTDFIYRSIYCFGDDQEIYSYEKDGNTKRTLLKFEEE